MPPLIYVMGPSGAGKDSVLRFARSQIGPSEKIAFAHRYITRPADPSEAFIPLSDAEFDVRRTAGLFAFDWAAHGFRYGIGCEVHAWRDAGFSVVISGSREHFGTLASHGSDLLPVLITASRDRLVQRLTDRSREDARSVAARIARTDLLQIDSTRLVTIDNSGPIENAGRELLAVLRAERIASENPEKTAGLVLHKHDEIANL